MTPAAAALIAALTAVVVGMWTWQIRHALRTAPATAAVRARVAVEHQANAGDLDAVVAHLVLAALHRAARSSGRHLTGPGLAAAAADPRGVAATLRREGTPCAYAAAEALEDLARRPDQEAIAAVITGALEPRGRRG